MLIKLYLGLRAQIKLYNVTKRVISISVLKRIAFALYNWHHKFTMTKNSRSEKFIAIICYNGLQSYA